ncbi:MAG: exodeoxyribonuclease VII large subunit [Candidatus Omnitrophica bacterium]|nr:exodeoxyribonuclease VII large subunit [Candidatus Omnitrophota bacterium]
MEDLFAPQQNKTNGRYVYTVSEITRDIKLIFENTFADVWVEGEVSNYRPSSSGHYYFSLKDENSVLSAVMFSRLAREVKFKLEDGLKIICFGCIDVYPPRGQYQLIIERVEPKGIGSLQLALEQLKQKLEKEGFFALERKRRLPYLPKKIALVTSISGAAIKDILKVLSRRFADAHIIIKSVLVQGAGAKEEISSAIKELNEYNDSLPVSEKIEVMIVGRGGGSMEDLWAFNEEIVARAIYSSEIPVISAVGHERDWTIADLVADVRAPTPSVAAELVLPRKEDLKEKVDAFSATLKNAFADILSDNGNTVETFTHRLHLAMEHAFLINRNEFENTVKKLLLLNPVVLIQQSLDKIKNALRQMDVRVRHILELREAVFRAAVGKLANLSPLNILARGYSITFTEPAGKIIKDAGDVNEGDTIKTKLDKGEIISKVKGVIFNG